MSTASSTITSFPLQRPPVRSGRRNLAVSPCLPYFVAGDENRMVGFVSTCDGSILEFGNPILLVGPEGAGKTAIATHLAARQADQDQHGEQAGPNHPTGQRPHDAVLYFTAVDFARQFAEAIGAHDLPPLRDDLNRAAVLVVDDLHLIANKAAAQIELALRIEDRALRGLPSIVTCRRLPSEIRGMKPTLVSRVLPGLTIPISPPTGAARMQILRELAMQLELEIDASQFDRLDSGLDSQLPARSLEAALKQISLWCRMNNSAVTDDAIASAVEIVGKSEEIEMGVIAAAVAKHFRLKLRDLRSSSRKQNLVRARSLAMLLARRMTSKSMHQIGAFFGGRDHTTVLHAIRKTESQLNEDADLIRAADEIREKLAAA